MRTIPTRCLLVLLLALPVRGESLENILARMDEASASFKSLTAHVQILKHVEIVNDNTTEEGTLWVKRVKPHVSLLLIEFTVPDHYFLHVTEKQAEIYRPKINAVEEYDISKFRDLANQLWLLSFGAAGRDLTASYHVTLEGEGEVSGKPAFRLELIPKSAKLLEHVPRIEMWVSPAFWQPVQQKFYEITPGDFRVYTYTGMNFAPLPDSRLRLPVAAGVKRIQPQK